MKFPPFDGVVKHVDVSHYDDLVNSYVEKVRVLEGVLGVTKFGSVSTPGLSDVDLVVTVADQGPWPEWEKISLRKHASGHPAESVVAHDIFVWPKSVARNAEAFFYVDQQTNLLGDPLGGVIHDKTIANLKTLVAMDYLIHRFESLAALLTAPAISLRNVVLFTSTLRHSCKLAVDLGVMDADEQAAIFGDISQLRQASLEGNVTQRDLDCWPDRLVDLLWKLTNVIGQRLGLDDHASVRCWSPSTRQIFENSTAENGVDEWERAVFTQSNRWAAKYVRYNPVPAIAFQHVKHYVQSSPDSEAFFRKHFQRSFCSASHLPSLSNDQVVARKFRVETVLQHWKFIHDTGYTLSSGAGYLGIASPLSRSRKSRLLNRFARLNGAILSRSCQAGNASAE